MLLRFNPSLRYFLFFNGSPSQLIQQHSDETLRFHFLGLVPHLQDPWGPKRGLVCRCPGWTLA